jgi:hypothetical protein
LCCSLFQWERGLEQQRKQEHDMQQRVVGFLAECEALWAACDVPKHEQARLVFHLATSQRLHEQVREWTGWAHTGGGNALVFKQPT